MNFGSDNVVGASDKVLRAILAANEGALPSYGGDAITARAEQRFSELFEREVSVFMVTTGTAANSLSIAAMTPPHGSLLTHRESHAIADECGAPEFFAHGAKLVGLPGVGGKLTPDTIEAYAESVPAGTNHPPLRGLSLSQATEFGLIYRVEEIAAVAESARRCGMKVHMDGARFANALVALNCSPAEMTWRAGIDVLSFGGTKNGCLMAEAVVFFDKSLAEDFLYKRKRGGQTLSKHRLISAQFDAYLEAGHWLDLARHANAMAIRLSDGLTAAGHRLGWEREANEVFVILDREVQARLKQQGAVFHHWTEDSLPAGTEVGPDEDVCRLVTSFATKVEQVDAFLRSAGTAGA